MNDLSSYLAVRHFLRPGDVVVVSGVTPSSVAIKVETGSPLTHTLCVRQGMHLDCPDVATTESTINAKRNGPQTNPLGQVLANYDPGTRAAALLLTEDFRSTINWQKFYAFIGQAEALDHYDVAGLVGWIGRELPIVGPYICQSEDPHKMFCDAYIIALFEASGALRAINWRKMSPQDLAEMHIYSRQVPLLGAINIPRFNSV